ncbi:MAG TPA: sodium:proton antiporter [Gemmatimonadaceae bacterium]|jgi:CPA1 family monovalent cation:H+ antiporter
MTDLGTIIVLFCIAAAAAVATRRVRAPYTVTLVVIGVVLGSLRVIQPPHLTKDLLFTVFLPGLLFEAALHIDSSVFRRIWMSVMALAIPGVIVAIAVSAALVEVAFRTTGLAPGFGWPSALLFAAVVAATDPVAVTALFREFHAPERLIVLIEGESLFNDGTAVVFLSLIVAATSGTQTSAAGLVSSFIRVAFGGAATGFVVGAAITQVIRRLDDAVIELTLTTIAAYGSFVLAESIGVSGVIATVVAGMLCGNFGRRSGMSATTRAAVLSFWDFAAFALNSVVFLLLGFEVPTAALVSSWKEILIAYVAVLCARLVVVFGGRWIPRLRRGQERIPDSWRVVLAWGGLRGALSMVLALALAGDAPQRETIVRMTAGVVVLSLILQGSTMAPLVRRLRLVDLPT